MMKKLLSRINWKSKLWEWIFSFNIIIFFIAIGMIKVGGFKPLFLHKEVIGTITELREEAFYSLKWRVPHTSIDCMSLVIDSFDHRIIQRNRKDAKLFKVGGVVKFWLYKTSGEYMIAQAQKGDIVLIKHNETLGIVTFIFAVLGGLILLLHFYVKKILKQNI